MNVKNLMMWGLIVLLVVGLFNLFQNPKNTVVSDKIAFSSFLKNLEEGRGITLMGGLKGGDGKTNYQFASSNPMWRATLEILDFLPLANVDYSGGIITTDWYNEGTSADESIKITVRFLTNEIRSDGLKIIVHKKKCNIPKSWFI